jgi:hypothetical protein
LKVEFSKASAQLARIDLRFFGKSPGTLGPFLGVGDTAKRVTFDCFPIGGLLIVRRKNQRRIDSH